MRCGSSASENFHAERVDNAHRAQLEQWAGLDLDDDRGRGAIAISLRGAREGCDVARADGQARASIESSPLAL